MIRAGALLLAALLPAALVLLAGDVVAADEPSAADIVRVRSATRATGPLPPPARVETERSPKDLLAALKAGATESSTPTEPDRDVSAWQRVVERTLAHAKIRLTSTGAGARTVPGEGASRRSLETHYEDGKGGYVRFERLEGGADDAARAYFDARFEPFESSGSYVRAAEKPGDRAAVTNTVRFPRETVLWQVGRVVVELTTTDGSAPARIDAAAREAGLYAEKLDRAGAAPDKGKDKDKGRGEDEDEDHVETDDDLPYEEFLSDAKRYDIPSLRAKVTGLRFFEGGMGLVPQDKRVYGDRFASESTRALYWELALAYRAEDRPREFRVDARWYRKDGTVAVSQAIDQRLEAGWTSSLHALGRGRAVTGSWARGTYRVELSIAGKVIASGTFTVTSAAHVSNIQLQHNQTDPQGQPGVLIKFRLETWGRLGQATNVVAYVHFPDGRSLKDIDGQYVDSNGLVASNLALQPRFESAVWQTAQIFFPYAQLHLAKGTHDLRVELVVYDPKTGKAFTRSEFASMSVTSN